MAPFRERITQAWKSTGKPITENIFRRWDARPDAQCQLYL
jgi:hypothetical protein